MDSTAPAPRRRLGVWLRWAAFAACAGLFALALARTDLHAAWARISAVGPRFVLVLLPFPIGLIFDCVAWQRLLAGTKRKVPLSILFRVRLATEAVATSTPAGAIWAEALAPVLVSSRSDATISDVVAASTARRWLVVRVHAAYVAGAAVLGISALSAASKRLFGSDALVALVLAGALGLVVLSASIEALATRGRLAGRVASLLGRWPRVARWIESRRGQFTDADDALVVLGNDLRTTRLASLALVGLWLFEGTETFIALRLLGADIDLAAVMSFDASLSILRSAAFFAPAGIGVQDVGYLTALEAYGVPGASGIAPAFIVLKRAKELFWVAIGLIVLAVSRRQRPTRLEASTTDLTCPR